MYLRDVTGTQMDAHRFVGLMYCIGIWGFRKTPGLLLPHDDVERYRAVLIRFASLDLVYNSLCHLGWHGHGWIEVAPEI